MLAATFAAAPAAAQPAPAKLAAPPSMQRDAITVSGLSSGAFFAHQFHIAFSSLVNGAGLIAGGPFGCVENIPNPYGRWWGTLDRGSAATTACSNSSWAGYWGLRPEAPRAADSVTLVRQAFARGAIDDPANLRTHRVWLYHGRKDTLVPAAVTFAVRGVYDGFGLTALAADWDEAGAAANHGFPVRSGGTSHVSCDQLKSPFIVECGFEAAERLLRHLYADGLQPASDNPDRDGALQAFDQTEFHDASETRILAKTGYLYRPKTCDEAPCRLHVAFHGCDQSAEAVDDAFMRFAGYNRWAATNRIAVLYPQAVRSVVNPLGCWDFWGYSGQDYSERAGRQMRAVKAMVDRMLTTSR